MDPTESPNLDPENPGETVVETGAAKSLAEAFSKLSQSPDPKPVETPPAVETPGAATETPPAESTTRPFKTTDVLNAALKPKEAPSEDDEMPEDVRNSTEKAKSSWRELKDQLKARTREAEALRKEMEEARSKNPIVDETELREMRERLEEQERVLKVSKVEATKEYREAVERPLAQIHDAATKLAEKHGLAKKDVLSILSNEDAEAQAEALSDLAVGLPEFDKLRLYDLVRENAKVLNLKKRVLGNAEEALRRIETARQQEEEKTREQRSKEFNKAVDSVWKGLEEAVPIFRPQEGNEAWNSQLSQLVETVRSTDVEALDHVGKAQLITRGAVAPILLQMLQDLHAEHQKVVEELNGIREATPRAGVATTPGAPGGGGDPDPDGSFYEAVSSKLRGL